jgi:hypothetical protein
MMTRAKTRTQHDATATRIWTWIGMAVVAAVVAAAHAYAQ